jgi:hypothetical protein
MNISRTLGVLVIAALAAFPLRAAETGPVYELRVYTAHPGKLSDLLTRFREHTCAIFEHHGMVNVGYWTTAEAKDGEKLCYFLLHRSREAAVASWKAFGDDPEWQKVQQASEAGGPLVDHVESVYLTLATYSPPVNPSTVGGAHLFELRTYTTNEGKLDALDARFRDHTISLFAKHGMKSLFYWHPTDADKGAGHTLVYLLVHESKETAPKSWEAFRADPEWIKARAESEKDGSLLIKDGVQSVYLNPTDFSPLR